ncbi:MAG: SLBB domain-containing protein [Deltaproteobacteria bacterium]|nr:SLBB domain-containing protein [Deltaproteobacteria bacterium]
MSNFLRRGTRFFLVCFVLQIAGAPVAAQVVRDPRILDGRGVFFGSSGRSFRGQEGGGFDRPSQRLGNGTDEEVFKKGMALSEGTLVGVTYQVHIVGEVKNPGTYRVAASDRLQEVLQRAGDVLDQGSARHIQIRRRGSSSRTYDLVRFRLFGELQHNPYLLDNDVIYVPLRKRSIQVVGSVRRPGIYEMRGERSLADALSLAGGMTIGAELSAPIRLVRFVDGTKQMLDIENVPLAVRRTTISNGDVIFVPNVLTAKNTFDFNVSELPGDQVFFPSYEDRVFVLGGVYAPGPYPFSPYHSINHYLTLAGGTTKLARLRRVKLIEMNGKTRPMGVQEQTTINPGDTIYVPESRLPPESWVNFVLGIAGFGLSATTAIVTLSR